MNDRHTFRHHQPNVRYDVKNGDLSLQKELSTHLISMTCEQPLSLGSYGMRQDHLLGFAGRPVAVRAVVSAASLINIYATFLAQCILDPSSKVTFHP